MSGNNGWIAVDLDGTLAHYDGWKGAEHIGEPIPAMVARVKVWLAEGRAVRIFTARVDGGQVALAMGNPDGEAYRDTHKIRERIHKWCLEHIGQVLPVTNVKDYGMVELWDDRAFRVIANTGETCCKLNERILQQNHELRERLQRYQDQAAADCL